MSSLSDSSEGIQISVALITYNHEKYVEQAINSVLMQDVNFKYEIVVGDDCSTDGTQSIVRRYAEAHQDTIRPVLRQSNLGQGTHAYDIFKKCTGRYLIVLEGDDYWTDPNKLQTQYDFLERHPEYVAVAHWCEVVDEDGVTANQNNALLNTFRFNKAVYSYADYRKDRIPGHINTVLFRNIYLDTTRNFDELYSVAKLVGDRTLYLILVLSGPIYVMRTVKSHYRYISRSGATNFSSRYIGRNVCYLWYDYYANLERVTSELFNRRVSLKRLRYNFLILAMKIRTNEPNAKNKEILRRIVADLNIWEIIWFLPISILIKAANRIAERGAPLWRRN